MTIYEKNPLVEKQGQAAGVPFKVLTKEPKESYKTGYAYYLHCKKENKPVRPLIGRFEGEQFQTMDNGEWIDDDFWAYTYPVLDKEGNPELNARGKPKNKPFFEKKYLVTLEFEEPIKVSYWDNEAKKMVEGEETTIATFKMSENLKDKIMSQFEDKRNTENTKFKIVYDPKKSPAEQYSVVYVSD